MTLNVCNPNQTNVFGGYVAYIRSEVYSCHIFNIYYLEMHVKY